MSAKEQKAPKSVGGKTTKAAIGGVHPKQHLVKVRSTNGSEFEIMTTWGKEGEVLTLDLDSHNHPAWQDSAKNFVNLNNERVNKFNQKFGGFGNVVKNNN
jgi:large subunit ribosomal protein L31